MAKLFSALVGYTGFVGQSLLRERSFDEVYNRININEIPGRCFSEVVCAGAPAEKWKANLAPEEDFANISKLWESLSSIEADEFTLISTVDVFGDPKGVDENDEPRFSRSSPYGANRLWLEDRVRERFENHQILRLPGLVGSKLKKNVIYDLAHDNNLVAIDHRSVFQFYPIASLATDIEIARKNNIDVVHLTAIPVSVADIAKNGFGRLFENPLENEPIQYDFRTRYAEIWGQRGTYQYSATDTYEAIQAYHREVLDKRAECH